MHPILRFVSGTNGLGYAKFSLGPEQPLSIFNHHSPHSNQDLRYQTNNHDSLSRDLIDTKNIFLPINKVHYHERKCLYANNFLRCLPSLRQASSSFYFWCFPFLSNFALFGDPEVNVCRSCFPFNHPVSNKLRK
jgi:hypothetical protein